VTPRRLLAIGTLMALLLALGAGSRMGSGPLTRVTSGAVIPDFSLPRLGHPQQLFNSADLRGSVTLLNVWASWCVGCRQEHDLLVEIARTSTVPVYGLNWRDRRTDARRWLRRLGDPYRATAVDGDGRVGAALGVVGAPETYVLDGEGRIVHRHVGPITREVWRQTLSPLLDRLRGRAG
jgi:cytochrome c biogenesis protein CcmG/thiol:disulfide interchange protein DsbE